MILSGLMFFLSSILWFQGINATNPGEHYALKLLSAIESSEKTSYSIGFGCAATNVVYSVFELKRLCIRIIIIIIKYRRNNEER